MYRKAVYPQILPNSLQVGQNTEEKKEEGVF